YSCLQSSLVLDFLYVISSFPYGHSHLLHPFPTRRSSDLGSASGVWVPRGSHRACPVQPASPDNRAAARRSAAHRGHADDVQRGRDRKSTRLNSSHVKTSYAALCVKKILDVISAFLNVNSY